MQKKNGIILGSGTYGEVFLTYLTEAGHNIIGFFDGNLNNIGKEIHGVKVLGSFNDLLTPEFKNKIDEVFCPIGNNDIRTSYLSQLNDYGYKTPNFIHSSVILNKDVVLGKGVYLLPGVIIMPHTSIEDFVIISMGSKIAHHTILENGVFVSTGVNVGANIVLKSKSFLGISSTIMTGVEVIGENSVIGCGAVVIKNVEDNIIVAGVPAKKLRDLDVEKHYNSGYQINKPKLKQQVSNECSLEEVYEKNKWDSILHDIGKYDFYHTYDYHALSKSKNETPVLLKYVENDIIIGIPLLIRSIANTNYKDATSVYGYAGPISKGLPANFDNSNFQKKITEYFANNFISVFSRLNPYIPKQCSILSNIGTICPQGNVVNIDLMLDTDLQRRNFRRRLKTHINRARRLCSVKKATTNKDLQDFIDIYYENMNRVSAKESYYFDKAYFENMNNSDSFDSQILLAIDNNTGKTIAASQFIITNSIVQYHLSGTKKDFLHLTPTKLLIDEMRLIASEKGLVCFNLGGGLGGRDNDSLFDFKASFSKDFKQFNLWKWIIDEKVYGELVLQRGRKNKENNYFPLYRSPDDININP
ncbi:NeuD/PglB/VioB family sugar acetyltransferase [Flavivirga sp. 57AJ16]|uniref:NeuD/PglB/VioB family sugar acetyltransferase n=1 Tax=Flavivirga sp. 57AJ16 TaxID=3025307 RepID=UPI002367103A|nr:NeuD/PglB/VioB family sugar acetyltransferase [Flavivirga sp. 57AJ16]MDD7885839.1 NeuD/PglB/VioB family sugar acetyltransferase [Flavivirga sp. 57AJ16]